MYSSEHIHREYNNFFQCGMVPLNELPTQGISASWDKCVWWSGREVAGQFLEMKQSGKLAHWQERIVQRHFVTSKRLSSHSPILLICSDVTCFLAIPPAFLKSIERFQDLLVWCHNEGLALGLGLNLIVSPKYWSVPPDKVIFITRQ